ncbi:MAG: S41 family peptidase [Cytophagales bacterium]|nr:S41 family peptidase [Cytophagales bacterium]
MLNFNGDLPFFMIVNSTLIPPFMRSILPLVFLWGVNVTKAQENITLLGKVNDKTTGEPIAYAHIYIKDLFIGTTSNQLGEYVIKIPKNAFSSFLVISAVGYENEYIPLDGDIEKYKVILMEPGITKLEEVVISPLDPSVIVDSMITKIPGNYYPDKYTANGFQREYVKTSGHYIQLMEVAFRTYGNTSQQRSEVLKASFIEDKKEKEPLWDPSRGGFYTFGWTHVSGIHQPSQQKFLGIELDKSNAIHKYYDFEFIDEIKLDEEEVYVVEFDQKKKVKKPLLKGTLYVSKESYALVRLSYKLSPKGIRKLKPHYTWGGKVLSKSPKKIEVKADRGEVTYKKVRGKWFLNSIVLDTEFDASLTMFGVTISKKENLTFHSERVITGIDTVSIPVDLAPNIAELGSIPTLQNFIKKEYEQYDVKADNWTGFNLIKSDTSFSQISRQLKRKNERWSTTIRKQALERIISQPHTKSELKEDIDYLQESLEILHPGYTWYTGEEDLNFQFQNLKKNLGNNWTEIDLLNQLAPIIENINCGHTEILPSEERSKYQRLYKKQFPLKIKIRDDQAVVTEDYGSIPKGADLASINGTSMVTIINKLKSFIPSDGYNETYKHFRLQNEFTSLYSLYYPTDSAFTVDIADPGKPAIEYRLAGRDFEPRGEPGLSKSFEMIDSLNTGYLKISSFRPDQTFPSFLETTFKYLQTEKIENLIIDVRDNQGGVDQYGALLYSYLASKPFRYYKSITVSNGDSLILNRLSFGEIPFHSALPGFLSAIKPLDDKRFEYLKHNNLEVQKPGLSSFKGKVYLLVNGGTFSAASEFVSICYSNHRGIIIGEETGGGYYGNCSLGAPILELPNTKLRAVIPLGKYKLWVNKEAEKGHGIIPHYEVDHTAGNYLRDRDLELCIELVLKDKK